METLGKRIVANRKRLGLTQDQLAEKLGVTAQAVSKWENDQSCPDITMLPKLADLFGVSTDQLLGREPEAPVHEAEVVEDPKGRWNHFNGMHNVQVSREKTSLWVAVLVIAVGVLYLLDGLRHWDLGFWTVLWTTSLTVYGLRGIWPRFRFFRLGCAAVGLYSLVSRIVILPFELDNQTIVAAAIVLFGLSLLADGIRTRKNPAFSVTYTTPDGTRQEGKRISSYSRETEGFTYDGSFGRNSQRVSLERLREGSVDTSFGEFTVDLSGVEALAENARLDLCCSFGELQVLVPRRFRIRPDSDTCFASFHVEGEPDPDASQTLAVSADVSFGEITVQYI